jgi:hypothetical protein
MGNADPMSQQRMPLTAVHKGHCSPRLAVRAERIGRLYMGQLVSRHGLPSVFRFACRDASSRSAAAERASSSCPGRCAA